MKKPAEAPAHAPAAAAAPAHVPTVPTPAPAAPAHEAPSAARSHADTQVGVTAASVAAAAAAAPARRAMLKLMSGANAGKELELVKPLTTLGKPGVQVAVITRRPQGFFITHVEGASKPSVNGRPIEQQAHALNDHDVIELAGVKVEFFFRH
jgi:hypothetical protein